LRSDGPESTLSLAVLLLIGLQAEVAQLLPERPSLPPPGPERRLDDRGTLLNGFVPQGSYEAGLHGAISRAQSLQGPLDGGWVVRPLGSDEAVLRVQLVDRGVSGGRLEGAWWDLRGSGPQSSGFFTGAGRTGTAVTLQFASADRGAVSLEVRPDGEGGFTGELAELRAGEAAVRMRVVMARP